MVRFFVYMHVERKKHFSGKDTNFPMKVILFLRKPYIFPLAKCYIETNSKMLCSILIFHLRLHIIHVENIFGLNLSAISLVFYCFLLLSLKKNILKMPSFKAVQEICFVEYIKAQKQVCLFSLVYLYIFFTSDQNQMDYTCESFSHSPCHVSFSKEPYSHQVPDNSFTQKKSICF